MNDNILIDNKYNININDFEAVTNNIKKIKLSDKKDYVDLINKGNEIIRKSIEQNTPIYGVTTGFGDSCRRQISFSETRRLQENLVKYHGCGVGDYYSPKETLGILLLRLISNARGYSGVRYKLLKQIELFINHDILPLIPEQGTVGASGDLTPLSYLASTLTGKRKVFYKGSIMKTEDILKECGIEPITLEAKEGLALMNGTSVMTAVSAFCIIEAKKLASLSELTTALTVEVLRGNKDSFSSIIHQNKPFKGQVRTAENIYKFLSSSRTALKYKDIISSVKDENINKQSHVYLNRHIQDKYSLRCSPHVIGVLNDTITWSEDWVVTEMNSVTDNPLIDYETGEIYSGGNFYGGHICSAMDNLRSSLASIADLIDKQFELIVDEKFNGDLTPNLIARNTNDSHVQHGFKAVQITCTSLVVEIMSLANPISALSRPTEALNQDKVSLGTISARYTRNVIQLLKYVLATQLLALVQAIDLIGKDDVSDIAKEIWTLIRKDIPFVDKDRELDSDIIEIAELLSREEIYKIIDKYVSK